MLAVLMNRHPEAKRMMEDWSTAGPRVVQFELSDEDPFYVEISDGKASFHSGKSSQSNVAFRSRGDIFFRMLIGQTNPDEAYSRQKYDILGSIDDAVRFRYIAEIVQKSHGGLISIMRGPLRLLGRLTM